MAKDEARLYEGMYVFGAHLGEASLKKAFERVTKFVEENGGEVKRVFEMGRKKLGYPINDHKYGVYYLVYFKLAPSFVSLLRAEDRLNEDLLRSMIVVLESESDMVSSLEFPKLPDREDGSSGSKSGARSRTCPFVAAGIKRIDYKNADMLREFLTEGGKILVSRVTGVSARNQKKLKKQVKRARHVALLPFVAG